MDDKVYLLKIKLLGIEPEIWRRFIVPGNISLDRMHDVIQIVMGWTDSHLHEFTINKKRYTENPETKEEGTDENGRQLLNLVEKDGASFKYFYDFGDGWEHEVTIEDSNYVNPGLMGTPVVCLAGARACPPEDVGGVDGYREFCKVMSSPKHKEYMSYKEWFAEIQGHGEKFDSEEFDIERVNFELKKYLRWSRNRFSLEIRNLISKLENK